MLLKDSLRHIVYQTEKLVQRGRFMTLPVPNGGWPILLGISFPKSGTHLLDQILLGFNQFAPLSRRLHSFYAEYEGESGHRRTPEQAARWLDFLRSGDIVSAHLFARPEIVNRIIIPAFLPYFIYRDPRDVVVSHAFYVSEIETKHVHHPYYQLLPDFSARLEVSILGRTDTNVEFPNIAERFAPYLGWLDQPSVMKIRFEDLIHERNKTLNLIIDHFLDRVPLRTNRGLLQYSLENSIDPSKSPTFRLGKTGEWKKHFTSKHKQMFKDVGGDLLIRLGYEKDKNW